MVSFRIIGFKVVMEDVIMVFKEERDGAMSWQITYL